MLIRHFGGVIGQLLEVVKVVVTGAGILHRVPCIGGITNVQLSAASSFLEREVVSKVGSGAIAGRKALRWSNLLCQPELVILSALDPSRK